MDVEVTLTQIRTLAEEILALDETTQGKPTAQQRDVLYADANELAEAVQALDGWLMSGGVLPLSWMTGRTM